jgi:enediyne biosynthesis protein E4
MLIRAKARFQPRWVGLLAWVFLSCLAPAVAQTPANSMPQVRNPDPDIGENALDARKKLQLETVNNFQVFYQFQFTDKVKESGITFVQHAVEEATRHYMANHYDHGNGIPIADIDGDGLYDIYLINQVGENQLWKNLGAGKFRNITQEAGVGLADRISVAGAFADIDNDGDQDLFVTTVRGGNVLFETMDAATSKT